MMCMFMHSPLYVYACRSPYTITPFCFNFVQTVFLVANEKNKLMSCWQPPRRPNDRAFQVSNGAILRQVWYSKYLFDRANWDRRQEAQARAASCCHATPKCSPPESSSTYLARRKAALVRDETYPPPSATRILPQSSSQALDSSFYLAARKIEQLHAVAIQTPANIFYNPPLPITASRTIPAPYPRRAQLYSQALNVGQYYLNVSRVINRCD